MRLEHVESNHSLVIDEDTGLPLEIYSVDGIRSRSLKMNCSIEIETGGGDRRNPVGGIEYFNTQRSNDVKMVSQPYQSQSAAGLTWVIPMQVSQVLLNLYIQCNRIGPALSIGVRFLGEQEILVRNLILTIDLDFTGSNWSVTSPGNGLRSKVELTEIKSSTGISPMGGLRGSSGLMYFSNVKDSESIAIWADGDVEIPLVELAGKTNNQAFLSITTEFSGDLTRSKDLQLQILSLDLNPGPWTTFIDLFQSWMDQKGVTSPGEIPAWVKPTMIFEAQLGYSIFGRVNTYGPYPRATDLIKDLDRIQTLGFNCIQLMPRQPYPSYNVHDYWDIDISYGDKEEIKRLIKESHKRGIKVILDVLLHGVLDKESITEAAEGVRSGPYKDRIDEKTFDSFNSDVKDSSNYYIAWSRHIIDFEDAWRDGSPERSPLIAEHPEWFYRNAEGEVTGVYTKAFDARSYSWQEYFISAMVFLVEELDIDGFRFDAPTYNDFPNWAEWASGRANSSALACVGLFQKLRPRIKALKRDALMYTEPSGHLLRKSMDLNYNYDEQWLVTALASQEARSSHGIQGARDFARWMNDRDALLPRGAMTAHHIDSHDTFWWPSWGIKWRREQFGILKTQLLTSIFGALPGPFMMFVGGEEGIEDVLKSIAQLKESVEYQDGKTHWWISQEIPSDLFGVSYRSSSVGRSVLVNMGMEPLTLPAEPWMQELKITFTIGESKVLGGKITLGAQSGAILSHIEL